jgi:HEAT repeat protein
MRTKQTAAAASCVAAILACLCAGRSPGGEAPPKAPAGQAYVRRLLERIARYPIRVRANRLDSIVPRLGGPEKALPLLQAYLEEPRASQKSYAVIAIGKCGKKALPVLAGLLEDKYAGHNAAVCLGDFGKDAHPHLERAVKSPHAGIRSAAAFAMARTGHPKAFEVLKAMLGDKDLMTRDRALSGLVRLGDKGKADLLGALKSQDAQLRASAARALGSSKEPWALTQLHAALADKEDRVRNAAVSAIGRLAGEKALQALLAMVNGDDFRLQMRGFTALTRRKEDIIPHLLKMTDHKNIDLAAKAIGLLARSGRKEAAQPLIDALGAQRMGVREEAARALGMLGDESAIGPLTDALAGHKNEIKRSVAFSLIRLGPKGVAAVKTFKGAPDGRLKQTVDFALKVADTNAKLAAQLGAVAKAPLDRRMAVAAEGVEKIGGKWPTVSAARDCLNYPRAKNRSMTAWLLGACGAADVLARLLYNDREAAELRAAAATALGEGKNAKNRQATDALFYALDDKSPVLRAAAVSSLGKLKIRDAADDLRFHLKDPDEKVRKAAAEALKQAGP